MLCIKASKHLGLFQFGLCFLKLFLKTTKTYVLRITIVFYCSWVSPLNKLVWHLCFYSWFSPSPNPRIKSQQVHCVMSTLIEPINPNFTFNKLTHQDSKLGMNLQVKCVCTRARTADTEEKGENRQWQMKEDSVGWNWRRKGKKRKRNGINGFRSKDPIITKLS